MNRATCIRSTVIAVLSLTTVPLAAVHAAEAGQQAFVTPEQAADALAAAWRAGGRAELLRIFGPAGVKLVVSGDRVAEKAARTRLASEYEARHRVEYDGEQRAVLLIGADEFPYPIPLVRRAGAWIFDTQAGAQEILDRRIGRNELNAIEVCRAYVEAQRDYASKDRLGDGLREFATRISSTDGRHDGLYWPAAEGGEESPFGPLIAGAEAEGYQAASVGARAPYHGYVYRILTRQGANAPGGQSDYMANGHMTRGFALVAFPAQYGNSGVMTFIVNQDGIVFEKNLGPDTAALARRIDSYDPDSTWKIP